MWTGTYCPHGDITPAILVLRANLAWTKNGMEQLLLGSSSGFHRIESSPSSLICTDTPVCKGSWALSCCWRLRRNPRDTIKQVAGFCGAQGPALPKMHQCTNEGAPSILWSTVPMSNRWRRKIPLFRYQHHRQRWSYWSSCGTGENPFQIQNDRGTAEVFRVGCAIERFILLSASHSHEVLARSLAICEAYWGPLPWVRPLWNECMFLSQSIVSIWRCTFLP